MDPETTASVSDEDIDAGIDTILLSALTRTLQLVFKYPFYLIEKTYEIYI